MAFELVREVIEQLREALAGLDPATLDGASACRLVEAFAELERLAAAGKTLAAGRAAQSGAWAGDGAHRDAGAWMAAVTGTTIGQANATLQIAQRLRELPATDAALRAGDLSGLQVEAISAAASADPNAEHALLASAAVNGVKGLKDDCARVAAAACRDEMAQYERIRARRSLRHWRDPDGTGRIDIRGPLDQTARVMTALEPIERELFEANRTAGRREAPDATAFDALVVLIEGRSRRRDAPRSSRPRATVHVHVSHAAFRRGHTAPGELCEIAGVGPIPVGVARELAEDCILRALIVDGTDVLAVSHLGRTIPARLRTAIEARDRECVIAGCHVSRHLEIDHNQPVAEGGRTELTNLHRLCHHHHDHKTRHDLRLEGTGTAMRLVPTSRPPPVVARRAA